MTPPVSAYELFFMLFKKGDVNSEMCLPLKKHMHYRACLLRVDSSLMPCSTANGGSGAQNRRRVTPACGHLYLGLFSHFQGILHFNAQIANRAFE
jgi:hypothetical protein